MAPEVTVPMNFGRRLLTSPTHNTLKLNTSKGGEVFASSVIMSFNSPVIDHMTTTLHMTSVDMLEFSKAAVQMFVDAAYSGTVLGLTKEIFRDVNKMANVFEITWLAEKCVDYFSEMVDLIFTPSYPELLYAFDEAAYELEHIGTHRLLKTAIEKIEILGWKEQFIEKYLENANRLSTKRLDMVIELAGPEVSVVVRTLTNHLSNILQVQKTCNIPQSCKYLLDNLDLHLCRISEKEKFCLTSYLMLWTDFQTE